MSNNNPKSEKEPSYESLQWFPEEILIYIFAHLDVGSLKTCGIVCSRWNQTLKDDVLWKQLFERDWSNSRISPSELVNSEDKWKRIYLSRNELGGQWEMIQNSTFNISPDGLELSFKENSWIDWDEVKYVKTANAWENGEHMLQIHILSLSASYLARGIGLGIIIRNRNPDIQPKPKNDKVTPNTRTQVPNYSTPSFPTSIRHTVSIPLASSNPTVDYVYWSNGKITHFDNRVYNNEKSYAGNKLHYPGVYVDMKKGMITFILNSNRIKTILDPKLTDPGCQVFPALVVDRETTECTAQIAVGPFKKQAKLRANIRKMVQRRNTRLAEQYKPSNTNTS